MTYPPEISVIVPAYNRAHLLPRAIASIARQTLRPVEIIIIDDCSTDDTENKIAQINCPIDIVFRRLPRNGGGGVARNAGIRIARGDYVAFLDSDDEWDPAHLATLAQHIRQTDTDYAVASSALISETGHVYPKKLYAEANSVEEQLHFVLVGNLAFQTSTMLMPRRTAQAFMFDDRLRRHQDWDLVFRMIQNKVHLRLCLQPTTIYHVQASGNISKSSSIRPSLRFLAKHRHTMSRKSIARFVALEVSRRKPAYAAAMADLLKAAAVRGISVRELAFYLRAAGKNYLAQRRAVR